jgi:hypothetical protein
LRKEGRAITSKHLRRFQLGGRLLAVLAAGLWLLALFAPGVSAAPARSEGPVAAPHSRVSGCPAGATCATIPAKCPQGTTCPEIIISATTDLGGSQWVFVNAINFKPNDPIAVFYCSDKVPLAKAGPECMLSATSTDLNPRVALTASPSGSASISYAVQEDDPIGNPPLSATVPGTSTTGSFFCDDYTNPCSIDVSDPYIGSTTPNLQLTPNNTAVVPVSFAAASSGCPNGSTLSVASDYGADRLFPVVAQYNCTGKTPVIGLATALDPASSVNALAGGAEQLALIDDPAAADVKAALRTIKGGYSLIPVALSATVVGYKAIMTAVTTDRYYPDNSFSLTPTMVAGLIDNYYSNSSVADIGQCGTAFGGTCSLLQALNYQPGFRVPAVYGAYVRSDATASTGELFSWICTAPSVPVYLGSYKTKDANVASKVLVQGLKAGGATTKSCPAGSDQFPSLTTTFAWASLNDPQQQMLKLSSFVPPPNVPSPNGAVAGFSPMNWSEANYNGLLPAALQNADGKFVLPSQDSLDAAVAAATKNADGTYTPSFTAKNPAIYPLPDIWYAVVPRQQASASQVATLTQMLDEILNVTAGKFVKDLPTGFVPLPTALLKQAQAAIPKSMIVPPPVTTTSSTTSTTTTTTTPPNSVPTTIPLGGNPTTTTVATGGTTTTTTVATSRPPGAVTPPTTIAFTTTAFRVLGRSNDWILPTFVSVLALFLLAGPGLLLRSRRRAGNSP